MTSYPNIPPELQTAPLKVTPGLTDINGRWQLNGNASELCESITDIKERPQFSFECNSQFALHDPKKFGFIITEWTLYIHRKRHGRCSHFCESYVFVAQLPWKFGSEQNFTSIAVATHKHIERTVAIFIVNVNSFLVYTQWTTNQFSLWPQKCIPVLLIF